MNVLWGDGVRDVNYLHIRVNTEDYAFHDSDISVAYAESRLLR